MYVLIEGNPVDGLTIIGPFKRSDDVVDYAENHVHDDWWMCELQTPDESEIVDFRPGAGCNCNTCNPPCVCQTEGIGLPRWASHCPQHGRNFFA